MHALMDQVKSKKWASSIFASSQLLRLNSLYVCWFPNSVIECKALVIHLLTHAHTYIHINTFNRKSFLLLVINYSYQQNIKANLLVDTFGGKKFFSCSCCIASILVLINLAITKSIYCVSHFLRACSSLCFSCLLF